MSYFKSIVESDESGVFIIAEACDNHMGSLDMAKSLARAAKYAGANAVKFQHHLVEEEMRDNQLSSSNFSEPLHVFLKRNSLTLDDHVQLKKFCDEIGIIYLCTPFSYKAAVEIEHLVPFYKIGSGEFQDYWFLDKLFLHEKPVIVSSGMSTEDEIVSWYRRYNRYKDRIAILNTLSEYPPILDDMNLKFIARLKSIVDDCVVIGHSDHSQTSFTSVLAVSMGAEIIEKHLTLSHFVYGPDKDVSLNVEEFKVMVNDVRQTRKTLGKEKIIHTGERDIRKWAYRSVVYSRDLKSGSQVSLEDIKTKRPGDGEFLSTDYELLLGKVLIKDVKANDQAQKVDYE